MLGKLIKHEFKATYRLYVPLFLAVIVLTPILGVLFRISSSIGGGSIVGKIITGFSTIGFVVMLGALCIVGCAFVIVRFYKTVATSEAYLTFCLPAKSNHILLSKLIVGVMWQVLSIALLLGALYVTFIIEGSHIPDEVSQVISNIMPLITAEYGSFALFLVQFGLILLVTTVASTLSFFLAICLGQLFNEHRVIASVGMYAAVYIVSQIISTVAFIPTLVKGPETIMVGSASAFQIEEGAIPSVGFMITLVVLQLVFAVMWFIGCSIIMKKKTNVR